MTVLSEADLQTPSWVFVYGTPAPQGSKKHVGNGRMVESSKTVRSWRHDVAQQCARQKLIPGAVQVRINFYFRRPPSAPKSRTRPNVKPDVDKLTRAILDAIVEAGWIEDDARVVDLHARKFYAEPGQPTGADINVAPILEDLR